MPSKFGDLGKAVKDLLSDDFDAGETSLTLKSKTNNGVAIKVEGKKCNEKNDVSGFLESTYTTAGGIAFKEKWNTKNVVTTEVTAKNLVTKGTKFVVEAQFSPHKGFQSQTIKADYGNSNLYVDTKLVDFSKLSAGAVYSTGKILVGASTNFKVGGGINGYVAGASYTDSDFVVTALVNNGDAVDGSIYHTPAGSPGVQAGVKFSYNRTSSNTGFEVGGAYAYADDTTVKVKVDKSLNVGLAYVQDIRKGVSLGLSASINAAQLGGDGHSLGLSLGLSS